MSWKFHLLVLPGSLLRPQSSDNPTGAGGPGWPHSCDWRLALAVSEAPRFCPMWPPRRQTGHLHSMLLSSPAPRGCQQRLQNASRPDSEVTLHHFHHTVLHRIHIVTAFNACHKASPESKKWRNRLHFFIEAAKSYGKGQAYRDGRHYYSHHCRLSPIHSFLIKIANQIGQIDACFKTFNKHTGISTMITKLPKLVARFWVCFPGFHTFQCCKATQRSRFTISARLNMQ